MAATFRAIWIGSLLPLLAACGTLSAISDATAPLDVYELRAPSDVAAATTRVLPRDVIIELPTTSGALETDRVMIRPNALAAQYLPDIRWSEPAPVMLQTLMLRTLDTTGALRYVGRRPLGSSGDFAIVSELVDFQAELSPDGETAQVAVRIIMRIVRERDVSIVATRTFTAGALAVSLDDADLIAAFDEATGTVLTDFADWSVAAMRGG
jgi:cholesterol transport system auxiliary component